MKLLSWQGTKEKNTFIQTESKGFNQIAFIDSPLFLLLTCLFTSCVLILAGKNFAIFGKAIGMILPESAPVKEVLKGWILEITLMKFTITDFST